MNPAPPPPAGSGSQLDDLLFECLERIEREGDSAVEPFLREHPDQADALRQRLGVLRASGLIEQREPEPFPERLGDFQLLERLGVGGMGVVYRALQTSLGREVALKLIRPEQLYFPGFRERFQREVETVARLRHPGIVAVHSVGREAGIPYFAMELVRGRSLEQTLAALVGRPGGELSGRDLDPTGEGRGWLFRGTWEEACLRVVRQVCEALAFAHDAGVLHRDIKPSNVMVTSEGVPRALLLDFGLARPSEGGSLTRTGSQVGSLRYMAPEALRGDPAAVDERSDVYSLGVTLYELLVLGPAFEVPSDAEVVLAIQQGAIEPLRRRNPSVSWELETICACATDPDPARRYPSAADFARDLLNALERRPIEARRASAWLRARRWVQRRPAAATALALGTLLVIGGPSLFAWQERRSSLEIAAQRDRALRGYESAMEAIDRMLSRVGGVDLLFVPAMEPLRRELLEDAVALLERVVAEGGGDLSGRGRVELARAHGRMGGLLGELARHADAVEAHRRARALWIELQARSPHDPELAADLVNGSIALASSMARSGDLEGAEAVHEEIGAGLRAWSERRPLTAELEALSATHRVALGGVLTSLGRLDEGRELLEQAALDLETPAADAHASVGLLRRAFQAWREYGHTLLVKFSKEGAVAEGTFEALEAAVALGERITLHSGAVPADRQSLATALNDLGGAFRRAGENEAALEIYERARETLEELVRDYPSTLTYGLELATVLNQLGYLYDVQDRVDESAPYYEATERQLARLREAAPDEPMFQHRHAVASVNLSMIRRAAGEFEAAESLVLAGIESVQRARELAPGQTDYDDTLIYLQGAAWLLRMDQGDHAGVIAMAEDIAESFPERWQIRHRSALAMAQAVLMVRADPTLDEDRRRELVDRYAERACFQILTALELGAPFGPKLGSMLDYEPLRGLPIFDDLVAAHASGG